MPFSGTVLVRPGLEPRRGIRHVLFDFDGTLSLIRQGWPEVMVPLFVAWMPALPEESVEERRRLALDDIMRLNGKQTIYQMIRLAERVRERGGEPREPLAYKHEYLDRLGERIADRIRGLEAGTESTDAWLVHGARGFLNELVRRGFVLYLASGTDEPFVRREARLLGIDGYFGPHIYGAQEDYRSFSKKMVIERILRENGIEGTSLMAFGDGYVEIENTREVGGLAIAIASDESANGSGRLDAWKHERLDGVGADVILPDFRDAAAVLDRFLRP
jgi:phosphoglycolate phosphatase-like HAD superfamily hydrolase